VAQARRHLDATRQDYRGWEYRYLEALLNRGQQTFKGQPGHWLLTLAVLV